MNPAELIDLIEQAKRNVQPTLETIAEALLEAEVHRLMADRVALW